VCTRWVPQSLTVKHKTERIAVSSNLLLSFEVVGETLSQIVKADETWAYCFELETKKALHRMVPSSVSPPPPKKNSKSPLKVTITVFWDCEGVILVDVILRGMTINSKTYIKSVTELRKPFKQVQPHKNPTEILLRHDYARLH